MKTTRWFTQWKGQNGWVDSQANPPEGWESESAASYWQNVYPLEARVVSREVEVSAKEVVKVKSTIVELEIAGQVWRRKEVRKQITWEKHDTWHRMRDVDDFAETYWTTADCKAWFEYTEDYNVVKCEEPEVERIWREYCE